MKKKMDFGNCYHGDEINERLDLYDLGDQK